MPDESLTMNTSNCFSYTSVNQRDNNEDYQSVFLLPYTGDSPPITVLVVADGMGGHEHGEDVSRQAVLKVRECLYESVGYISRSALLNLEDLKHVLLKTIERTHDLVLRMVQVNGWKQAGSTIVVAAIWGDRVIATNLGDSPLFHYVARQGQVVRVTQDHSVPGILAQANLIPEEMVRYHERRGQLEFFLGAEALPPTELIYERQLQPGDLLLLCSDGVSGLLNLEQITAILARAETNLKEKANALIRTARVLGETDNQTLILWQYSRVLRADSTFSDQGATSIKPDESLTASFVRSDLSRANSQISTGQSYSKTSQQGEQTVIQSNSLNTSLNPDQNNQSKASANYRSTSIPASRSNFESKTLRLVRAPKRRRSTRTLALGSLVIGLTAALIIVLTTILPYFLQVLNGLRSIVGANPPTVSQPQPTNVPSQQLNQPTAPKIPMPAAPAPSNTVDWKLEFANGGSTLITTKSDGSSIKWQLTGGDATQVCEKSVPPGTEDQQRIVNIESSPHNKVITQGENGCIRSWSQSETNWMSLPELWKGIL